MKIMRIFSLLFIAIIGAQGFAKEATSKNSENIISGKWKLALRNCYNFETKEFRQAKDVLDINSDTVILQFNGRKIIFVSNVAGVEEKRKYSYKLEKIESSSQNKKFNFFIQNEKNMLKDTIELSLNKKIMTLRTTGFFDQGTCDFNEELLTIFVKI